MGQAIKPEAERYVTPWGAALLAAVVVASTSTFASAPARGAAGAGSAAAGKALYAKQGCEACHKIGGKGGKIGPDLSKEGTKKRSTPWLVAFLKNPKSKNPKSTMPPVSGSPKELADLAAYLQSLK